MPDLVTLDDIRAAAERIRDLARVTPLLDVGLAAGTGPVWLKCENLQNSGAFKIRGAANMLRQLTPPQRNRGVITFSSGNHGLALALAARESGCPAVIVMPTTAAAVKVEGARRLGAEVIFEGRTTVERKARAEAEARSRGLTIVPPFDHPWIIAGQGTIGLEIVEQCPTAATVLVPVSGGGLIAGVSAAIKALAGGVRLVGVEPAVTPRLTRSLEAGTPVTVEAGTSIADGLLAVRPGDLTLRHALAYVDEVVTVDDRAIAQAVEWLFKHARLVAEPSGAATVAAILARRRAAWSRDGSTFLDRPGPIVAVLSGGNVEASAFAALLAAQPLPE